MSRITQRTIQDATLANLQRNMTAMNKLQETLSSGRTINRPSDDPTGTVSSLQVRADMRAAAQHTRNADDAIGWLTASDTALQTSLTDLRVVRNRVLQGLNSGAINDDARSALSTEINEIRASLVSQANTTYLGRPIFAGTTGGATAIDPTTYQFADTGTGTVQRVVSDGASVRVDIDGAATFGEGETSVFAVLDRLSAAITAKDDDALRAGLAELDGHVTTITTTLTDVGARYSRVNSAQAALTDRTLELKSRLSGIEDADLPATIVALQMQETVYQAALGATAKVLQPSLMDFLS